LGRQTTVSNQLRPHCMSWPDRPSGRLQCYMVRPDSRHYGQPISATCHLSAVIDGWRVMAPVVYGKCGLQFWEVVWHCCWYLEIRAEQTAQPVMDWTDYLYVYPVTWQQTCIIKLMMVFNCLLQVRRVLFWFSV